MKNPPRRQIPEAAVIGPGAIGTVMAGRLASAGVRVTLVGRSEAWRRRLLVSGARVEAASDGRSVLYPARNLRPQIRPKGPARDLVLICVKSPDTALAARSARPLVGPNTIVVSLQNGLTHRPILEKAFGKKRTVFGITYISAERAEPCRVRHHGGDALVLAAHPGNAAAVKRAAILLKQAGWKVKSARSEDRLLWTKAAFNAASNPLGALTGRTNGELVRIPALRDLALRALGEAVRIARAAGHPPLYPDMESLITRGLLSAPEQPNSMLQDLRAGRSTEIDAILGPFLRAGRARGVAAPTLEALHRFIRRLERNLR